MRIKNAKFITSAAKIEQCLDYDKPEIAVAGKSNVGKSSFINFLANNKNLAKTSSTPGRTRLINYFEINNGDFMLVDLPGYGYAKVGGTDKDNWDSLIGSYLTGSKKLTYVLVLVDVRHEPSNLDKQMVAFLHHYSVPFCVIATKADKLSRLQVNKQKTVIANAFSMGPSDILACSALKKTGMEDILGKLDFILEQYNTPTSED